MYMWRLHAFALALLVAHVSAFSSTPARTDAREPPVPDPPPLKVVALGAIANFGSGIDQDGDGSLSFLEAYEYGRSLPCNNYTEYQVHLLLTWRANDADGDGNYTKDEARGHFLSLPAEVQEEIAGCAWHAGNGRRLSDAEVALASPAFAATVKPAPLPLPIPDPEFNDNYASYESTRLGLDVLFKCFEYERCPPGVTPDGMDDFLSNVLTHFKTQDSIAQLTEQVSNAAVKAIKDEADERNADLRTNSETVHGLQIASAVAGGASLFLRAAPGVGLFLTGSSIGTMVASQVVGLKQKELQEAVMEYITGFQKKVVDRPEMVAIREWSDAGSKMGAFFPRLQIGTSVESMWALFASLPVATQAAMTDESLQPYMYDWKQGEFYCPDPCTYPYDHLTVDAMKTYIKLMAAPPATLQFSGEPEKLRRYMLELANATVGELEQVELDGLTDINTKYFGEMIPNYAPISQGILGLYTVPVFFMSAYQLRPSSVWKWWRAGAPIYDYGFTRRYTPPASKIIGINYQDPGMIGKGSGTGVGSYIYQDARFMNRAAGFPSAEQLSSLDDSLVKTVLYDMEARGQSYVVKNGKIITAKDGHALKATAREMMDTKPGQWSQTQTKEFRFQISHKNTRQALADQLDTMPYEKSRLAQIGRTNQMGKWTRRGYMLGKGLVVLVSLAFIVFEVFAIVAAQEIYQEYANAIQKTAEGAAQYYQEVISAYSEQEEAPPEKA